MSMSEWFTLAQFTLRFTPDIDFVLSAKKAHGPLARWYDFAKAYGYFEPEFNV